MFYAVSKACSFVATPWFWAGTLAALALVLVSRHPRGSAALLVAAAGVLGAFASPKVVDGVQRWVESSAFTTMRGGGATYDAFIVLGGGGADERLVEAARQVAAGRARFLLYSGTGSPEAERSIRATVRALGVRSDRFVLEGRSRNTHENAVESARVAAEYGWRSLVIVTSAAHVPRALGCYRAAGLDPDVLAVDYQAPLRWPPDARVWPSRLALQRASEALHEVVGRAVYRAVGYTG